MDIAKEIEEMKRQLILLADTKDNQLNDAEVYKQSCAIDEKIVEFVKNNVYKSDLRNN